MQTDVRKKNWDTFVTIKHTAFSVKVKTDTEHQTCR